MRSFRHAQPVASAQLRRGAALSLALAILGGAAAAAQLDRVSDLSALCENAPPAAPGAVRAASTSRASDSAATTASPSAPAPAADPTDSSADPSAPRPPQTYALLVNGGSSATKNYLSHLHHLQDMLATLAQRGIDASHIAVFSADGKDPGKDLAARGGEPGAFWLIDGTPVGRSLGQPDLTNSEWKDVEIHPAKLAELRRWFAGPGRALRAGDTLFIFVTDHGNKNNDDPGNGVIALWNDNLSVLEFRALLGYLDPGVRVVNVMSQCFSGAFSDAMAPLNASLPGGNVCGFYSTTGDRPAYGCYPEGRDRDRIGHAFRFIDALGRHADFDDAHASVLLSDSTPDVPIKTSDVFLEKTLADEAARRKIRLEELADRYLVSAWKTRERWEPQIRLLDRIGQVYGTFSPRTLAELAPQIETLQSLSKELDTYEGRWKLSLDDLRKDNLAAFELKEPDWKDRLDIATLEALDPAGKKTTLVDLLAALEAFSTQRTDVWGRLKDLLDKDEESSNAQYRTDVRLAALMRMRAILLDVAGREMLSGAIPERPAPVVPAAAAKTGASDPGAAPRVTARVTTPAPETALPADADEDDVVPDSETSPPTKPDAPAPPPEAEIAVAPLSAERLAELRRALDGLESCESSRIGLFDTARETSVLTEPQEALPAFEKDLDTVKRAMPSWLGVQFRPVTDKQRERFGVERGATLVEQVYGDGPAGAAGIQVGDIILGPPNKPFTEPTQIREWTMSSPRDVPLALDLERDGTTVHATVTLAAFPVKFPTLPEPPKAGDPAPAVSSLKMVRQDDEPIAQVLGERHMLIFWATWCSPCKASLPELMAWSQSSGVPIVAVSDEDEEVISKFLSTWKGVFPGNVASDDMRRSHQSYGVSGTPTFVLVDGKGKIEWRQVGYSAKEKPLSIPGWTWSGPGAAPPPPAHAGSD